MTFPRKLSTAFIALGICFACTNAAFAQGTGPSMANPLAPIGGTATLFSGYILAIAAALGGVLFVLGALLVKAGIVPAQYLKTIIMLSFVTAVGPAVISAIYTYMTQSGV